VPVPDRDRAIAEALVAGYDESAHGLGTAHQATSLPDDFLQRFALVGPPAALVDRIGALRDRGLDRLVVVPASRDADPGFVADSNARFAAEVLPHL